MQRVVELPELMIIVVVSLEEENFNLSHPSEQLNLFGEGSENSPKGNIANEELEDKQ